MAVILLLGVGACGASTAVGTDGSAGSSGGDAADVGVGDAGPMRTFPCMGGTTANCVVGGEYCFLEEWNGSPKVTACRPYPPGCSSCACAELDAKHASIMCAAGSSTAGLVCVDGTGPVLAMDAGSSTLIVMCQIP
jgi:hypothetical protein